MPLALPVHEASSVKPKEIRSLQAARGIAALLVVVCHASAFIGAEPGLWQKTAVYLWLRGTAVGVQLFFVISGIVIFRAHRADIHRPHKAPVYFWKRFRRIYPLYWIVLTLTLRKHRGDTSTGAAHMHLPSVVLSSYALVHVFSYQTVMVQAWTLFDEVQFYLVFSLCILHRRAGLLLFGLWLAASLFFLTPGRPYWFTVFSPYHLLFGLGVLVALALEAPLRVRGSVMFASGAAVFVTAVVMEGPFQHGVAMRLLAGAGAAVLLYGGILLEREGRMVTPRWLMRLGDASYSIYLVHFMVISAVARFAYAHLRQMPVPVACWLLCLVVSGVAAGVVAHYAVERPLLRLMGWRERAQVR